ncbi:MAG: hypothetical protein HWD61_04335 [Parachlamydiaceae bacterium]|nr:MAG: hypothetical protein HWD61_04335 [Parachlamydiaceae bacterium]
MNKICQNPTLKNPTELDAMISERIPNMSTDMADKNLAKQSRTFIIYFNEKENLEIAYKNPKDLSGHSVYHICLNKQNGEKYFYQLRENVPDYRHLYEVVAYWCHVMKNLQNQKNACSNPKIQPDPSNPQQSHRTQQTF